MKAKTPTSPKFGRLARRLGLTTYATAGILELLWLFARDQAPAGDVGRWDDADISAAIGWEREPSELIEALVAERWLDRSRRYRLVIHGWSEHADDSLHRTVARMRILFADGAAPRLSKLDPKERAEIEKFYSQPGTPRAPRGNPMGTSPVPSRPVPPESRPVRTVPPRASRSPVAPTEGETPGSRVFKAYSVAYEQRYDVEPVRNAQTNALTKKLVEKIGEDEAQDVAAFYVGHNDALYVRSGHCLELLIRDAPKLRTEWYTGRRINGTQARRNEATEANPFLPLVAEERNSLRGER